MYNETIVKKVTLFDDTEVTITKSTVREEYFAEWGEGYSKTRVPCGTNILGIYDALIDTDIGEFLEEPEVDDLVFLAAYINSKLPYITTVEEIKAKVLQMFEEVDSILPAHVFDDIMYMLDRRFGRVKGAPNDRIRCTKLAPIEDWLDNAITSRRIYRVTTENEFDEQPVVILNAHPWNNDWYLELACVYLREDDNGVCKLDYDETAHLLLSKCYLTHSEREDVPPEYLDI